MRGRYNNIDGNDLYNLRGGVLHKGTFDHAKASYNRVLFIGPESNFKVYRDIIVTVAPGVQFSGISVEELRLAGKILQVDVMYFCGAIMDAARAWAVAKVDDPYVQRNLPNLVRFRPEGLPPFSVGVPTIA